MTSRTWPDLSAIAMRGNLAMTLRTSGRHSKRLQLNSGKKITALPAYSPKLKRDSAGRGLCRMLETQTVSAVRPLASRPLYADLSSRQDRISAELELLADSACPAERKRLRV